MSVQQTDTIDYITRSEDGGTVTLTMVEDRPLDAPGLVDDTVAKMNAYLIFIGSGHLEEVEPAATGASVRVQYNVLDDPETSPDLMAVLRDAAAMFSQNGVEFVIRHFNVPA